MISDPESMPRVPHTTTAVPDVRAIPLQQLANLAEAMLRRIVPPPDAERVPVNARPFAAGRRRVRDLAITVGAAISSAH